jgi:hypothetical protein
MEHLMEYLYAFLAGFGSTLTFHQGTHAALYAFGLWPKPPYPMAPTKPLKIPAVISLALWGGLWGVLTWLVIRGQTGADYWIAATVFGAILPSIVALFIVFPLKAMPVAGGGSMRVIVPVLILNGAWGLGVAVFMKVALSAA